MLLGHQLNLMDNPHLQQPLPAQELLKAAEDGSLPNGQCQEWGVLWKGELGAGREWGGGEVDSTRHSRACL